MPNFKVYKRQNSPRRLSGKPTVTIQSRGLISFSPSAIAVLGYPKAIAFLYDKDEKLIGFRSAKPDEENAHITRSPTKRATGRIVSALAFCRFAELDLSVSRRYPLIDDGGIPCIDLKQPGTPVTSNRRKH